VELSQNEVTQRAQAAVLSSSQPRFSEPPSSEEAYASPTKPQLHKARTASELPSTANVQPNSEQLPQLNTSLPTHPKDSAVEFGSDSTIEFDVSSDLYKKKIEALRQDFGSTWLSALGDESWDSRTVGGFQEGGFSPPLKPALTRTPSHSIVSGGRTLG
jgi:hypothetical protein